MQTVRLEDLVKVVPRGRKRSIGNVKKIRKFEVETYQNHFERKRM